MSGRATFSQLLGKSCKAGCMFGGELEVESNTKLPIIDTGTWKTDRDPSLRSAFPYEYTTRSPIPFVGVDRAISTLLTSLNDKTVSEPIAGSTTTSWHVHLNALEMTATELMTRLFLYWVLEPIIIKHCGLKREQNTFALQLKDSYHTLRRFDTSFYTTMISEPERLGRSPWFSQEARYASQNMSALVKFGSIEYRAMNGTLNKDEIMVWINTLTAIWQQSHYRNPSELLSSYYDLGAEGMLKLVLGESLALEYKKYIDSVSREEADENAMALLCVDDNKLFSWDMWEDKIAKSMETREIEALRTMDEVRSTRPSPTRPNGRLAQTIEDMQYRARQEAVRASRAAEDALVAQWSQATISTNYITTGSTGSVAPRG